MAETAKDDTKPSASTAAAEPAIVTAPAKSLQSSKTVIGDLFPELLVEAIGTFALIFMGVGAIVMTNTASGPNLIAVGLAHGLAIALMVAAAGHISGGAYNPAVCVALVVARKLAPLKAVFFIIAELVGAVLAAWLLTTIFPAAMVTAANLGVPSVGNGFSQQEAFIAEIVTTFFLVYVIFGVAIDKRGPASIAALCIGLTISMDIFATGNVSGAAMNPARWFGPALVQHSWDNGIIWIAGPLAGALLAAVVYFYIYLRNQTD